MGIISTAVLVASICMPGESCKVVKVADFYNESGKGFCAGTAAAINSVGDEVGVSDYFCVTPKIAAELFADK